MQMILFLIYNNLDKFGVCHLLLRGLGQAYWSQLCSSGKKIKIHIVISGYWTETELSAYIKVFLSIELI